MLVCVNDITCICMLLCMIEILCSCMLVCVNGIICNKISVDVYLPFCVLICSRVLDINCICTLCVLQCI